MLTGTTLAVHSFRTEQLEKQPTCLLLTGNLIGCGHRIAPGFAGGEIMAVRSTKKREETDETNIPIPNQIPSSAELQTMIANRAYEIYLERNGASGDSLSDWLLAEREVLSSFSEPIPTADNVIPINSVAAKRKRPTSAKTATSRTSTAKKTSATRARKRKEE